MASWQFHRLAGLLGVNETSVICLILSCATSLAVLPLFGKMDTKGKLLNSAFAVSGSYLIGGQFGYISSVAGRHRCPGCSGKAIISSKMPHYHTVTNVIKLLQ